MILQLLINGFKCFVFVNIVFWLILKLAVHQGDIDIFARFRLLS